METELITIRDAVSEKDKIKLAADILMAGDVVAIPTETVYGLAADGMNPEAVKKIYAAKGRPADNPLILHIHDESLWDDLALFVPPAAKELARAFWPGPLTVILPKSDAVNNAVSGGLSTVAVRMPAHPVARAVIAACGRPLAAPSANSSGTVSPTSARHVMEDLGGKIPLVVDGGECPVGLESTVVDLSGEKPQLLRPGFITPEELREILPDLQIDRAVTSKMEEGWTAASPGMKYKHYSPKADITIVDCEDQAYYALMRRHPGAWALCFEEDLPHLSNRALSLGRKADFGMQAYRLFGCLHRLDQDGARMVYARKPVKEGIALAVYNRLMRAAGFKEIDL